MSCIRLFMEYLIEIQISAKCLNISLKKSFKLEFTMATACNLYWVSAQIVATTWLPSCWEYICMHMGVQTTCVSNTPWGPLWGVTSQWESWNVIWGCGDLVALGIRGSLTKGSGVSALGHVCGIRNLDPPDPQRAVKYCWKERNEKEKKGTTPWRFTARRGGGAERKTDRTVIERKGSDQNETVVDRYPSRMWMWNVCDRRGVWE